MSNQIYFDDVSEGQTIPTLEKQITSISIVMYMATIWFFDRIHFDHPYATKTRGLPNVVAPGSVGVDYYAQLLSDWAGEKSELRKLSIQYRNFMVPGDILTCGGKIIGKYIKDGKGYLELELWISNQNGINCAPGKCVLELPIREMKKR
jgi:hydroxyacyl-ACP dehydratase HTD2-like protein with hotdog domain